jgi:hypothetical protein
MQKRKFWPFDCDPDGEIYENVAWDLPGYRRRSARKPARQRSIPAPLSLSGPSEQNPAGA